MKKKLLLLAAFTLLITGCGSVPKLKNGEEILVELKDGTKYSVDEVWSEFKENYAMNLILNKIDEKILEDVYKDSKEEVDDYISSMETNFRANYKDESEMEHFLNQVGYASLDDYLKTIKTNRLREITTNEYAKGKISDKEIEKYYKDEIFADIEAVHILVKPTGTDTESDKKAKEEAQKIINDIKKDIKSGTKAIDAFKKYEKNDKVKFEDLGKFSKGKNVEEFDNVAFKLKEGAYTTSPVKTSYGYHVILKTKEYKKDKLEDKKDEIAETLAEKLVEEDKTIEAQAMNELRKKNKLKFHDKDLDNAYNKYMNYLLNKKE